MADWLTDIQARMNNMPNEKDMAGLHPEVNEREHVASFASDRVESYGGYSYLAALGDYEQHQWVRKAVKVLTENFSPLPVILLRDDAPVEEAHEITDLLDTMNDAMSRADVWQQWVIDMLLGGEEAWELVKDARGNYVEIFPRQPHTLQIVPDAARSRYYQVDHYSIDDGIAKPYDLPPDELIHFKFFNPRNPWRGLSVIGAVRNSIAIDTFAQAWSKLFFRKSARPDYAVMTPQGTSKTEREQIELELAARFGGTGNAHKPIVLEQGITDIKFLDWRPKDLEWIGQRELAREEIGSIFGVPDEIMGWGRDTYENFDTALFVLWSLTLLSLCGFRDTRLTKFFRRVGKLQPNEQLVTDISRVTALKKNMQAQVAMLKELFGMGVPFNAGSAHLGFGLRIDGGDVGYLPANLIPVTDNNAKQLLAAPRACTRRKGVAYESAEHRAMWETFVKRTEPHERKLGNAVAGLFEQQEAEVLERLRATEKAIIKTTVRDVADNPFDRAEWEMQFRKEVKPILRDVVTDAGKTALLDIAIDIAFDVSEPAVRAFLLAREQRFAQFVNETTWQQLKDSLTEGLDNGETLPDLMSRVENVMAGRIRSSSEVIARTEVIGASNGGTLLAWEQSDVVDGKVWLAALDKRTRETHVAAHGQQVGLHEDFSVGGGSGPAPGQIGLAEEDIQCRCTMTAVLKEKSAHAPQLHSFGANGNGNGKHA